MKTLIRANDSYLKVLLLTISFYSVPLDLDVKFKAILMGACFLVVSIHGIIGPFDCKQALHFEWRGKSSARERARERSVTSRTQMESLLTGYVAHSIQTSTSCKSSVLPKF